VASILVLWDVDYTLINPARVGRVLYEMAFREMFGGAAPRTGTLSGRTDSAIALEVLTAAGLPDPRALVPAFQATMAARADEMAGLLRERGQVLPGAAEALAAVAGLAGPGTLVVQSLLTGNIRRLAEVKLGALGLLGQLDLDAGAYGDLHEDRAQLVPAARLAAARGYGADFSGQATVLIGDTPLDVEAALATGARVIAVATGEYDTDQLAAAGAHCVLPDLTDTARLLTEILAPAPLRPSQTP
jgi:phosphoglycolate phosphatase-like HAD superfamily hydrolase